MAMVVKNNMTALNTLNTLNKNSSALAKSLQKVSSGMKINSAADDASGYAISERMRVQIRSLDQANQNTQNGSSMMKVAEGAVSSTVEILKTLKEKAVNAANDSNTDADRQTIQKELDQSIDQINDNANVTFNGKYLVDGSKNTIGNATYTALSNQSLAEDTKADTKLVDLAARSGDSLEIHDTDKITVSYVQGGKTYSATFQVGDKTLGDIFAEAENIDKSSQIFATSSNEAVKAAGGADGVTDVSAEKKAIEYLKAQLADGKEGSAGVNITSKTYGAAVVPAGNYHTATTAGKADGNITSDKAGTTALTANSYTDASGKAYAAGDLYTAVVKADEALVNALADLGDKSTNNTLAYKLNSKLTEAGITWDGQSSSLESSDMSAKLEAAYAGTDGLREAVEAYRNGVKAVDTAEANMEKAVTNYTDAQKQLAALEAQDKVKTAQDKVDVLKEALVNQLKVNLADTATNKQIAYSKDIEIKAADGAIAAKNDVTAADTTEDRRNAMLAAFEKGLTSAESAVAGKAKDALEAVAALFKGGAAGATQLISNDDVKALTAAIDAVKGVTAPVAADLKAAQENVVSKFSGPALLTGASVGVNAAGETVETASGKNAITITANASGIGGQISGINISVSDAQGNVKKSANAALDAFEETVRAQNKSDDNAISLQVGAKANQSIKIGLTDMRAEALGLQGADGTKLNISTQNKANAAINVLDNAIQKALDQQTTIGSVESRLEYTSSNLTTASENVQASESTIRDADMAKEMMQYTKNNVLLQAAQSMLAQANQSSSNVLSLLQ